MLDIAALADSGRATTVGRPTAGGSGTPVVFPLPGGGLARFSTGAFHRTDGSPIEGVGLAPHVHIAWTAKDLRAGRDPDVEAAEGWLVNR